MISGNGGHPPAFCPINSNKLTDCAGYPTRASNRKLVLLQRLRDRAELVEGRFEVFSDFAGEDTPIGKIG